VPKGFRILRRITRGLYDFRGLRTFKEKLSSVKFEPVYILYPAEQNKLLTLLDVVRAFIPQGMLSFGFTTLLRIPPTLCGLFVFTTLMWTALLAQMDTTLWFPSRTIHTFWVLFDLFLVYGFWKLFRHNSNKTLLLLTCIISLDVILTLIQIYVFNYFQPYSYEQYAILLLGIFAPLMTAVLFWLRVFSLKKLNKLDHISIRV
jgi:hypothetical protein